MPVQGMPSRRSSLQVVVSFARFSCAGVSLPRLRCLPVQVPEAPAQQQTFMEDLPEEEQDTSGGCWPCVLCTCSCC